METIVNITTTKLDDKGTFYSELNSNVNLYDSEEIEMIYDSLNHWVLELYEHIAKRKKILKETKFLLNVDYLINRIN